MFRSSSRAEPPTFQLFFFNYPATTEIYTLSLHDALPISEEIRLDHHVKQVEGAVLDATADLAVRRDPPSDRKSTRLNSSHVKISYAVFCLKKKKRKTLDIVLILENSTAPLPAQLLRARSA